MPPPPTIDSAIIMGDGAAGANIPPNFMDTPMDLSNSEPQIDQNHEDGHVSNTDEDEDGGVSVAASDMPLPPLSADIHDEDTDMMNLANESVSLPVAASSSTAQIEASLGLNVQWPVFASIPPTTAMSQLSQQLEQIQEAQGNGAGMGLPGHIESVHFNSIPPTSPYTIPPLTSLSSLGSPYGIGIGGGYLSTIMANLSNPGMSANVAIPIGQVTQSTAGNAISQMHPPPMAEMHPPMTPFTIQFNSPDIFFDDFQDADSDFPDAAVDVDHNSYTLSMHDFLVNWGHRVSRGQMDGKKKAKGPDLASVDKQRRETPKIVHRSDLQGDQYDIQGMNWLDMDVTRRDAREARRESYKNYESIRYRAPYHTAHTKSKSLPMLPNNDNFLRFRRMDLQHKAHLSHFQLRNLIACSSRSNVFFAGRNKVHRSNPLHGTFSTIMDLSDPDIQPVLNLHPNFGSVQISTIASKHDLLIAGGFNGEYAMININSTHGSSPIQGVITEHPNSITNHIALSLSRSSGLPQATFASNDSGIRVLDCTTNTFSISHAYNFPVNCTAISPDSRLRVVVGDTKTVSICDTESGKILQELEGHNDFGFACAWADNGWHVASGNQDMTVKIWDARMWTDRYGTAKPLQTIGSELAGVRSLQFSPVGSGKRILLACEAADVIDVIDGESYKSKQVLEFFGEIGGACFTPDGQDVFVANCDSMRGGIIEFERTGEGMKYRTSKKQVEQVNSDISRNRNRARLEDATGGNGQSQDVATSQKHKKTSPQAIAYAREIAKFHGNTWGRMSVRQPSYLTDDQVISHVHMCESQMAFHDVNRAERPTHPFEVLQQKRLGWIGDDVDMLDIEDDGYFSIEEQMRRQARGYDWRRTDAQVAADSRSNDRTQTWRRTKHLFGNGSSEPVRESLDLGL